MAQDILKRQRPYSIRTRIKTDEDEAWSKVIELSETIFH
mgnify:CR=1 FL=1